MATVGLKGIWGLEQLDRTGLPTWKLALILLIAALLVGNALMVVMSGLAPNPFTQTSSEEDAVMATMFVVGSVCFVFLVLAMARAIESDLEPLSSFDDTVDTGIQRLRPTRSFLFVGVTLGPLSGLFFFPVVLSLLDPLNPSVAGWFAIFAEGWGSLVNGYVLLPIVGLTYSIAIMVVIRQGICLIHVARHIKIDILQLNDYSVVANAGVRFFLAYIPFLSFFLLVIFLQDEKTEPLAIAFNLRVIMVSALVVVTLLLLYGYPVWILRNRIRDQKIVELAQVTRALRGDRDAANSIAIQGLGKPTTTSDLLTHQMFLESRWEWPIASHVQKIILFGLLPPLTWVLAAMIENSVY